MAFATRLCGIAIAALRIFSVDDGWRTSRIAGTGPCSLLKTNDMGRTRLVHKHRRGGDLPKIIGEPSPRFVGYFIKIGHT